MQFSLSESSAFSPGQPKGRVPYSAFSDSLILAGCCAAHINYEAFEKKNLTRLSAAIKLNKFTKLTYFEGKWKLAYKEMDNYSVYICSIYKSNITYGKHSKKELEMSEKASA